MSIDETNDKKQDRRVYMREKQRELRASRADIEIPEAQFTKERERASKELFFFAKFFFPQLFSLPFSPTHKELYADIQRTGETGGCLSRAITRGFGKSTSLLVSILFLILHGKRRYIVLCKSSVPESKELIADIIDLLSDPDSRLAAAYPEVCQPFIALEGSYRKGASQTVDGERTKISVGVDKIVFPCVKNSLASGAIVRAKSAQSKLRGLVKGGVRPDFVLCDDIESTQDAYCEASQKRLTRFLDSEIQGLAGPGKSISIFLICTIQRKNCVSDIYTDAKKKPSWNGKRYSALISEPDRKDLWLQYEVLYKDDSKKALSYYRKNRKQLEQGSQVLWKDRYDRSKELSALQSIMNFKISNGETAFLTEYQNQPPAEIESLTTALTVKEITSRITDIEKLVVPNSSIKITCGIDVGKYICHYVLRSEDINRNSHIVDYGTFDVPQHSSDVKDNILSALRTFRDTYLKRDFYDENNQPRRIDLTLIDSGYCPDAIFEFTRESGHLYYKALKGHGSGIDNFGVKRSPYYLPKDKSKGLIAGTYYYINKIRDSVLVHIDCDNLKEQVQDAFRLSDDTPGGISLYKHESGWTGHLTLAHHIASECIKEEFITGKGLVRKWIRSSKNNHLLDCLVYSACGASIVAGNASKARKSVAKEASTNIDGQVSQPTPTVDQPRPPTKPIRRPVKRTLNRPSAVPF